MISNKGNDANESGKNMFSVSMAAVHAVEHALVSDATGDGAGKGETSSGLDLSLVPRELSGGCSINIGDLEARDLAVSILFCVNGVGGTSCNNFSHFAFKKKKIDSCRLHGETNVRLR